MCYANFPHRRNLIRHIEVLHGITKLSCFSCSICNLSFLLMKNLKTHYLETYYSESSFECLVRRKIISEESNMGLHMRNNNCEIYNVICSVCCRSFTRSDYLRKHIKIHDFLCTTCYRRFPTIEIFARHIAKSHNSYKPYKCVLCNVLLSEPIAMKKHSSVLGILLN